MSEEKQTQTNAEKNSEQNTSTQASQNNVPYDRFTEVNTQRKEALEQNGKLQAELDKIYADRKEKEQADLVEQGKAKEALELVTKERDKYKAKATEWDNYQVNQRESLMSQLTDDKHKSIAEGLSDLGKLGDFVQSVTATPNAPSTSTARATSGKTTEMGGYGSWEEFAIKDPINAEKALHNGNQKKF
tara:strand:+ start:349 stop:912 length:564 start_codon:yes stop_codon:yes gene_type:complete